METNIPFAIFLIFSMAIGLTMLMFKDTSPKSIMMWGQFYFITIVLASAKDKEQLTQIIKYFVYLIFFADILSNLLLALGFSLPWTKFPPIRPGEMLPRFPGVKFNPLYSGSISFLAICCLMQEEFRHKWLKKILLFLMCVNLFLAGSFRYYITLLAVFALYRYKIYNKPKQLLTGYGLFIIGVILMTFLTQDISKSNELRWKLWIHTIDLISNNPLWGEGFFFQDLKENVVFSYHNLAMAGVTESTILLLALCFGYPLMAVFLYQIYATLKQFVKYPKYEQELGLFLGLSLDLFWGGSLDNCMSLSVLFLSLYRINYVGYTIDQAKKYTNAPLTQEEKVD